MDKWKAEQAAAAAARPYSGIAIDHQRDSRNPYGGRPVPKEALLEGVEPNGGFLDNWHEDWHVVPAANGTDALVFSTLFVAETSIGDVIYNEDDRRAEELDSAQRLADTISIHVRLEDGANECRRVVKFLGSSPSSYRIEYLHANPRTIETSDAEFDPDVVLALHQRWALQCLAACRYIHAKGIIINASLGECTWLRPDLSIVIAGLVAASCPELEISPGFWLTEAELCSPFRDTDSPKTDLFNWACWIYELMTDRSHPLVPLEIAADDVGTFMMGEEGRAREMVAQKGIFRDWPVLKKEQLGPCLFKAWNGEYESAEDALHDVRSVLRDCGRVLTADIDDEISGFDWEVEFRK